MTKEEEITLGKTACKVRMGVLTATHEAKASHPGGSLSAADVFTYLYFRELNIDPQNSNDAGNSAPLLFNPIKVGG